VTPPFPAPPIEGRSARLWLRLGVAGLAVAVCCGGGLAAVIGLFITGTRAINEQAQTVVTSYLDDVRAGRYSEAYDLLCDDLQGRETRGQFAARVSDEPRINEFVVGDVSILTEIALPVDVTYRSGNRETLRFLLMQDRSNGALEVCGIDG
jgi:hypothetical protein